MWSTPGTGKRTSASVCKQIVFPSQRDQGVNGGAVCGVGSGAPTTHHADRPVAFGLIVSDMVNADVSHVLATIMRPDFGEHKPLKFSPGDLRLCHYFASAFSPSSTSRRMASGRPGRSACLPAPVASIPTSMIRPGHLRFDAANYRIKACQACYDGQRSKEGPNQR